MHDWKRKLQTHTQNTYYLLIFRGKNGYASGPQCYVINTLSVLLNIQFVPRNKRSPSQLYESSVLYRTGKQALCSKILRKHTRRLRGQNINKTGNVRIT